MKRITLLSGLAAILLASAACERHESAEDAAKHNAEDAGQAVKEGWRDTKGAAREGWQDTKDAARNAGQDMQNGADKTMDSTGKAMERGGEKLQEKAEH